MLFGEYSISARNRILPPESSEGTIQRKSSVSSYRRKAMDVRNKYLNGEQSYTFTIITIIVTVTGIITVMIARGRLRRYVDLPKFEVGYAAENARAHISPLRCPRATSGYIISLRNHCFMGRT